MGRQHSPWASPGFGPRPTDRGWVTIGSARPIAPPRARTTARGSPMPTDDPAFSITVSTIAGWDEIRKAVGAFEVAAERVRGEVVVMDGSPQPAPPPDELSRVTSWHKRPGLSVFQMREIAYRLARAPIVAITEDHVI